MQTRNFLLVNFQKGETVRCLGQLEVIESRRVSKNFYTSDFCYYEYKFYGSDQWLPDFIIDSL
jgi:hypothetical protein